MLAGACRWMLSVVLLGALWGCREAVPVPDEPPPGPSWQLTGAMLVEYGIHTATLLLSGKVLVVGEGSAEVYDPDSNTWSATGSPIEPRILHTATLLPSGKVLVAGGLAGDIRGSAELYDPDTGTWAPTASMAHIRYRHSATRLPSGKVLVAGGDDGTGSLAWYGALTLAELYDPDTETWSPAAPMNNARFLHASTALPSGKVLVDGGIVTFLGKANSTVNSREIYDPVSNTWTRQPSSGRFHHTATLLPSGKVLLAGGKGFSHEEDWASLYDSNTDTWTGAAGMTTQRAFHAASVLPSGEVLVAGGTPNSANATAEVYNPITDTWTRTVDMNVARLRPSATLLPSGKVLVVGGGPVAEIYAP